MTAGQELQLHRPVVGLLARGQDRRLRLAIQPPRARTRPRRPRAQTRPRDPLSVRGRLPAMPPPVRGRGRDAQGRRGGPERRTTLDQAHQLQPALQSELAPTVLHVRPPSAGLSSQTAPSVGGRTPSYPFSKSVGSSPRRALSPLLEALGQPPHPKRLGRLRAALE